VVAAWKFVFMPDEKEREKASQELFEALQFLKNELKESSFEEKK